MFRRNKWLILIPTLLLIPLLVGMVPMKLANKMAHGGNCAQSEGKEGCGGQKNCSAHSLISQNHFDAAIVSTTSPDQGLGYCQEALYAVPESVHSSIQIFSIPLRI
ncbi:MAG: hypothetical protein M0009_13600 [Deltaproteobacteria bacterium]|nr:hypothetical protein [Deltaproteobacteria bacterium]